MNETERIELPNGWWEIYTIVTRGMRKAFRRAAVKAFALESIETTDPQELQKTILQRSGKWDVNAIDDTYLLYGTAAWSFPEPVSLEAIDKLPDEWTAKVLARMGELYAEKDMAAKNVLLPST